MTATLEITVRQVFSLPVFMLTVNSTMDPTATSGFINLLMRPMVGLLLQALFGLLLKEVSVQYEGYQCEQLMGKK